MKQQPIYFSTKHWSVNIWNYMWLYDGWWLKKKKKIKINYLVLIVMLALLQESKTLTWTTTLKYLYIFALWETEYTPTLLVKTLYDLKRMKALAGSSEKILPPPVKSAWSEMTVSGSVTHAAMVEVKVKLHFLFSTIHKGLNGNLLLQKKTQCCYSSALPAVKTDRSAYLCVTT